MINRAEAPPLLSASLTRNRTINKRFRYDFGLGAFRGNQISASPTVFAL
jgi:hypothetical protein